MQGVTVRGMEVQSISGLLASDRLNIDESYSSVFLSVGGNDLADGLSPRAVLDVLVEKTREVLFIYLLQMFISRLRKS